MSRIEKQGLAKAFTQHMMGDFEILPKVENHKEESSDLYTPTRGDDTRGENHSLYCLPPEERVTIQEVENDLLQNNMLRTVQHFNTILNQS